MIVKKLTLNDSVYVHVQRRETETEEVLTAKSRWTSIYLIKYILWKVCVSECVYVCVCVYWNS